MRLAPKKLTYIFGLAGSAIATLGSLLTALAYRGQAGEAYSVLNHFISELGELGVSQLAPVFNICLFIGGLFLAVFMLGLGLYLRTTLGYIAAAVGFFCGLACSMVGMFPMNNMATHVPIAYSFFYSGLATMTLFTIAIILDKQKKLPRWLAVFGLIGVISFARFLAIPHTTSATHMQALDPRHIERPTVWINTILEWSIFFAFLLWVVLVSLVLALGKPAESPD